MPRSWLYYIALLFPLVLYFLVTYTGFVEWLWYHGYQRMYYILAGLRVQPQFQAYLGGWPFPIFVGTAVCFWAMHGEDGIPEQFIMLPLAYVPFHIIGRALVNFTLDVGDFYTHALVILPFGYVYVLLWVAFIKVMDKCRLVI